MSRTDTLKELRQELVDVLDRLFIEKNEHELSPSEEDEFAYLYQTLEEAAEGLGILYETMDGNDERELWSDEDGMVEED